MLVGTMGGMGMGSAAVVAMERRLGVVGLEGAAGSARSPAGLDAAVLLLELGMAMGEAGMAVAAGGSGMGAVARGCTAGGPGLLPFTWASVPSMRVTVVVMVVVMGKGGSCCV